MIQQVLFGALLLAGLGCLAGSFYYGNRKRHKLRERSRSLFVASLGLLMVAAVWGWL